MGLLDFLGGGNGAAPDLYAGALTPEQQAAMRQQALGGAMAGLLKSGALDYTVPFISGKVPGGFAAGLAGAAAGAQDATNNAANIGMKAQEFLLNRFGLQQKLDLIRQRMAAGGLGAYPTDDSGNPTIGAAGGATPPEMQSGAAQGSGGANSSDPLDLIEHYESGGQNIPNYRFDPGHTAQGYYQITNTTWRNYAPKAGVDLSQYPNAMSAPKDVQRRVAGTIFNAEGFGPWANFNPRLATAIQNFEGPDKAQLFNTGPVTGLGQATAAPIRVAQNGPLTSLPSGSGGSSAVPPDAAAVLARGSGLNLPPGRQYLPTTANGDVAPSAVDPQQYQDRLALSQAYGKALDSGFKGTIQDFVAQNAQGSGGSMPPPAGALPMNHLGASGPMSAPVPQIADNTNAPPPPPAAMPQGLLPQPPAAAPVNPIMQPPAAMPSAPPTPGAAPAGPAQPPIPSGALTPAQRAWVNRARAMADVDSLLGIKSPAYLNDASTLDLVGPKAAATANAELPSKLYLQNHKPTPLRSGIMFDPATGQALAAVPTQVTRQLPDGSTELGYATPPMNGRPASVQWTGVTTKQSPAATSFQETTGRIGAENSPPQVPPTGPAPSSGGKVDLGGSPIAKGLTSSLPDYTEPLYSAKDLDAKRTSWTADTKDLIAAIPTAQAADQRLADIQDAFKMIQTGAFTEDKADFNAKLKAIFGDSAPQFANANPAEVEKALHANYRATLQVLSTANKRFTQNEFAVTSETSEHPDLQPEANLQMLAEDRGQLRQIQALGNDWVNALQNGKRDFDTFKGRWLNANPISKIVPAMKEEIGQLRGMPGGPGGKPAAEAPIPPMKRTVGGVPYFSFDGGQNWFK